MEFALALPAPAKLNLFLRVTGRRADGYHDLQTAYALIDLADLLDFERRDDGLIERQGDLVGDLDSDLVVRAARALQTHSGTTLGAAISVTK
ncbi:MAG TPA: 4-(cytidine 5'-diphospho)-2-C-methyl-D-erythritol kinase, partial [Burkholderiaceae bacterium]|nr:4-(cytidine 5'-diphospho)-2-C-methyl-D-erythritol kinase [Burkholderiaceae bacterium]